MQRPTAAEAALAAAVGLVLADSSVVVLGLPEVIVEFGADVAEVAWVITAFNLALAIAAIPSAMLLRKVPAAPMAVVGLLVFGGASAACALSGDLDALVGARVVQALGGALVLPAALVLLVASERSDRAGSRLWISAGVVGAALGPALGGLLTELLSWEAIFWAQVPVALAAAVVAAIAARAPAAPVPADVPPARTRPDWIASAALLLLSSALAAALFLIVILMVNGWRMTPLAAAIAVSAMPAAALIAPRIPAHGGYRALAGGVLVTGGLVALALLPGASWVWTILPQALIGLGLGLAVESLTAAMLEAPGRAALHGGVAIAARHAGVVLGLLVLTPVFTGDLEEQSIKAERAGAAVLLDADLPATQKVTLAVAIADILRANRGTLPDLAPAFAALDPTPAAEQVEADLQDQIERAGTAAFSPSFLWAALLSAIGLIPLALLARRSRA